MNNPDDQLNTHKFMQQDQSFYEKDMEGTYDQSKQMENIDDSKVILKDSIKQTLGEQTDIQDNKNKNMFDNIIGDDHKLDADNSRIINKKNNKKQSDCVSDLQNDLSKSSKQRKSDKLQQLERSSLLKNYFIKDHDSVNSNQQIRGSNINEQVLKLNKCQNSNPGDKSITSSIKKSHCESNERIQSHLQQKLIKSQNILNNRQPTILNPQNYKNSVYRKKEALSSIERISLKFVQFFDKKTYSGRTKSLSDNVREKIKDKSDYINVNVKKIFYSQFIDMVGKVLMKILDKLKLNKIPLFNPEQKWRIAFNTLIVLFNCFYIYIVSLKIAFNSEEMSQLQAILQQVAQVVWLADMLIQMNTAMYHNNEFTEDRKIIMKTFLKEYFFFEVLPIIFENLHSSNLQLNIVFHLPLLLKIKGIMIMLENLEFYILQMLDNHSVFFLIKLILQMILFAHILACSRKTVIAYESTFEYEQFIWSQSSINYHNDDQGINYLQNMFWAFSLMLNVSHPLPSTKLELLFTSCCMLISCIAFGYLLTSISVILSQLNKGQEDYKRDLNILNQYMKRKKIEIGIKRRANISLKKYYDQMIRIKSTEERATLDKVDNRMFRELQISSNQRVIKYCPILEHLFTESTLEQICVSFEEVFYSPHETIVDNDEKQSSDCFLYIVIDGKIKVCENYDRIQVSNNENNTQMILQKRALTKIGGYSKNKQSIINQYSGLTVEKGEYFGLIGFMLGRQLITRAQSLEYTTLLRISRSDVEKIIQNNTRDREIFMEMRDRLLFSNDISNLLIECAFCKSKSHLSQDCNLLHFDKSNPYIHWKSNYSQPQTRDKTSQRKTKYINALNQHKYILEFIEELRSNYGIESTRKLDDSDQLIEDSFNMQDQVIQKESEISEEEDNSSQFENSDKDKEQDSEEDDKSINSLKDVKITQNKKKKNHKKEKNDKIRQQKTMKEQMAKNKDIDDSNQYKHKKKSNSYHELKCDDQIQQKHSSLLPFMNDLSKGSQQSHHRINEMTNSGLPVHLSYNQLLPTSARTKSVLVPEKEEEILTYDLVEDDLMSRKNIQKRSSYIFSKGYGIYFHDGNLDKLPSQNSQLNIQRIPTLEAILKKQSTMHSPSHNQSQKPLKQKLFANNSPEKSNTINSSPNQRKKKNSLSNQCSINLNSSFNPTLSIRETRSFNGSRKDNQTPSRMKTRMTSKSGSMNQSYVKFEHELKQLVTNSLPNLEEDEFSQNLTEKQETRPQQRQYNQDKKFYWYFDKIQNFQFYFWTYNSTNQIKKYNYYIQQRKSKSKAKILQSPKREKLNNSG